VSAQPNGGVAFSGLGFGLVCGVASFEGLVEESTGVSKGALGLPFLGGAEGIADAGGGGGSSQLLREVLDCSADGFV
jgi:hypothetical protein